MKKIVCFASTLFLSLAPALADSPTAVSGFENITTPGMILYSSPTIANIDNDISNGNELVVLSQAGILYAYRSDGSKLWQYSMPNAKCSAASSINKGFSSPAVGDLDGDGKMEVVSGYGGLGAKACGGGVVAIDGATGARKWLFDAAAFARKEKFWINMSGVYGTPALGDVDGNGRLEIAVGSFDRNVYLLNYNGTVRAYYNAADTVWSSPTFADINGDGKLELIAATDISANARLVPPTYNGGILYAFKTTQRAKTKLVCGFRQKDCHFWMRTSEQVFFSSPAIGDVLPNSPGDEIVLQSGCFFPQNTTKKVGKWIRIYRLKDGRVLKTIPTSSCSSSSPALADVDEDGVLDIVATVNGDKTIGGDGNGKIVAWSGAKNAYLWQTRPTDMRSTINDLRIGEHSSPIVADIDGNGSLEVIAVNSGALAVLNGIDGTQLSCDNGTNCVGELRFGGFSISRATPAVGDINVDGVMDVVAVGRKGTGGTIKTYTALSGVLNSAPSGTFTPYETPWPMFKSGKERMSKSQ